jgi:hypothetical protein
MLVMFCLFVAYLQKNIPIYSEFQLKFLNVKQLTNLKMIILRSKMQEDFQEKYSL